MHVSAETVRDACTRRFRYVTDDGYLLVPSSLDPADLARITTRLAEHVRQTVATWAEGPSLDTRAGAVTTRFDLDDPGLATCYQHPLVADAAATVLADGWHLQGLGLRAPIPGSGEQGLHQDFAGRGTGPTWQALSAMWCISEFTRDNGPLQVIPGSHLVREPPIDIKHGYAAGMGPATTRHGGRRRTHLDRAAALCFTTTHVDQATRWSVLVKGLLAGWQLRRPCRPLHLRHRVLTARPVANDASDGDRLLRDARCCGQCGPVLTAEYSGSRSSGRRLACATPRHPSALTGGSTMRSRRWRLGP
jgi:hypothetical protein